MAVQVSEIRDDSAFGRYDALFDDVRRFRFTPQRGGFLRTRSLRLGEIRVAEVTSAGHDIAIGTVPGMSFLAPQSGRIGIETAAARLEARQGGALVLGPGGRETFVRGEPGRPFRAFIALAPGKCDALEVGALADAPAARSLAGFLRYLFDEIAQIDSPLLRPGAQDATEALIRDALADLGPAGSSAVAQAVSFGRVRAAQDYIHAHADAALSVEQIARAVGVGPRALQVAFRAYLETTPRDYLAEVRLERARGRLTAPAMDTTVTDAALESGFAHLSRFAAAYRRRYGELPSQTLARARRAHFPSG